MDEKYNYSNDLFINFKKLKLKEKNTNTTPTQSRKKKMIFDDNVVDVT